jgi:hypothetical protein
MPLCKVLLRHDTAQYAVRLCSSTQLASLEVSARECALCRLFEEELRATLAYTLRNSAITGLMEESIMKRGLLDDNLPQGWDVGVETNVSVHFNPEY